MRYLQFECCILLRLLSSQNVEDQEKLKGDKGLKQIRKISEMKEIWLSVCQSPVTEMEKMIWVLHSARTCAILLQTIPLCRLGMDSGVPECSWVSLSSLCHLFR